MTLLRRKITLILLFFSIVNIDFVFGQIERLNRADNLKEANPELCLQIIDSVINNPTTKSDALAWSIKAYATYYIYKHESKLRLYSSYRDSILSFLHLSNNLKPDTSIIRKNKKMFKSIAADYLRITKKMLEDSLNFEKSDIAFSHFKNLYPKYSDIDSLREKIIQYYLAKGSVICGKITREWQTNSVFNKGDYLLGKNAFRILDSMKAGGPSKKINGALLEYYYQSSESFKFKEESLKKQNELEISEAKIKINSLNIEKQKNAILLLNKDKKLKEIELRERQGQVERNLEELKLAKQEKLLNETELNQQKLIRNSFIIGFGLILILAYVLFRNYRVKQKANYLLEEKNKLIEKQKHLVEEKHKEITDSINYAERIQRSFLATKQMLDENLSSQRGDAEGGGGYFVFFKPKDVVSGDFYWAGKIRQLDNSAISKLGNEIASEVGTQLSNSLIDSSSHSFFLLATADSTGHGVPGAIMSLLNITSLEKAIENLSSPEAILNHTRKTIIERLKKDGSEHGGKDGMDCSLIAFDFKNKRLLIANANNPVWIVRGKEVTEIKADKMPVGKHDRDQESFTLKTFDFETGDAVYALTDGFPDQFGGPNGKKFMSKNLRELLVSNAQLSMQEQKQILESTFTNWVGDLEQVDDVTVIGVRL